MNFVFITLDGARIDRILKSPVIKELSKDGTIFTNVIANAPYTIAAMHAIFSGEYGFKNGVNSYWSTYRFKKDQYKTLTQYLRENGFRTFGDAINELVIPPEGFEELNYHDEDKDDLTTRHKILLTKMNELKQKDKFFLYLHYSNIHTNIKHNVLKKYNNFSKEYFDNKNENEKQYDIYFKGAEQYLAEIIEHYKKNGLMQDTLLLIISDHGISVGDKFGERAYGAFCYDYTIKTFALFLHEKIFPPRIITQQVRSIDLMPTLLEVFHIELDPAFSKITGKSLIPLIRGDGDERPTVIETGNPLKNDRPPQEPNVVALRKNDWKLILNLYNGSRELYHLVNDPSEENNLVYMEPNIEKDMMEELRTIHPNLKYEDVDFVAEQLEKLGYWQRMYKKDNVFGIGPTKLAIIADKIMKKNNIRTILELGCGQGRDCVFFAEKGYFITATDFSIDAVNFVKKIAKENKLENLKVQLQDMQKEVNFNEKYDCVYSNLALQFFNESELSEIFAKIASCLNSNGLFIFSTKKPGDKYYRYGEKISESAYKKNLVRYFFDKDTIHNLVMKQFKIDIIDEKHHTNPDGSVSEWWYVIARLL